jgi:hypothetical protein
MQRPFPHFGFSSLKPPSLAAFVFLLFFAGECDKKIYEEPCGAPCKYGKHMVFLRTNGVKDPDRLEDILDSLGFERRSNVKVEPRYLIGRKWGIDWLGERTRRMTLSEYNERLNAGIELFDPARDYFYREVLYSEKELTGDDERVHELMDALHMDLGERNDVIGYLADLCSAYEDGCEKAYPSVVPVHQFGVEVHNPTATEWNKDSAYDHFPFMERMEVSFYKAGKEKFFTDETDRTVSFGIELRGLSCTEIQELGYRLGTHPDIRGLKGGSALESATPVGCSEEEVEERKRPDL